MTSKANNVEKTVVQKKSPDDFVFGKVIGEGSFSTVFLAKELATKTEYAGEYTLGYTCCFTMLSLSSLLFKSLIYFSHVI